MSNLTHKYALLMSITKSKCINMRKHNSINISMRKSKILSRDMV